MFAQNLSREDCGLLFRPHRARVDFEQIQCSHHRGIDQCNRSVSGFAGPYSFGYLYTRSGSFSAGLAAMMLAPFAAGCFVLLIPYRPRVYIAEAKPIGALLADPTRSPDGIEVGGIE
jgi:hypothetical protein